MGYKRLEFAINGLNGTIQVPGDKSVSHRAIMFGSIANGVTTIQGLLESADVKSTIKAFQDMGVQFSKSHGTWTVNGRGFDLEKPKHELDMGNSGTSTRLLMGLLAGQPFPITYIGDESLSKRPLGRVLTPLSQMGLQQQSTNQHLPVTVLGGHLNSISYTLPVASAQVKSAILLAGLQAEGKTTVIEPIATRDHTERLLRKFGVCVKTSNHEITIQGGQQLQGTDVQVPGDMSSAAFWLTAGLLVPNSHIKIQNVGVNPTRIGLLRLFERMGAAFEPLQVDDEGEAMMDLSVETQPLSSIDVVAEDVPGAIDELPLLVLAATQAEGTTTISGASELRVKESDRITAVTTELNKLGADIIAKEDGFIINGGTKLAVQSATVVKSFDDHRIAMMLSIAALLTEGEVLLDDEDVVDVSYPTFFTDLDTLMH